MIDFAIGICLIFVSFLFLMTAVKGFFVDNHLFDRAKRKNEDDTYDTLDYDLKTNKFVGGSKLSDGFIQKIGY